MFDTDREAQFACRQIDQRTGQIREVILGGVFLRVVEGVADVADHRIALGGGDHAGAQAQIRTAEDVERYAAGNHPDATVQTFQRTGDRVAAGIANRVAQIEQIDVVLAALGDARIEERITRVPVHIASEQIERSVQRKGDRRVVVVEVRFARAHGDRTEVHAAQVLSERIEHIAGGRRERPLRAAGAGSAHGERHFGQLLVGIALDVHRLHVGVDAVGQAQTALGVDIEARDRLQQIVHRREVVAVGAAGAVQGVTDERAEIRSLATVFARTQRLPGAGNAGAQTGARAIAHCGAVAEAGQRMGGEGAGAADEIAVGGAARTEETGRCQISAAKDHGRGNPAIACINRFLVLITDADHRIPAIAVGADGEIVGLLETIALGVGAQIGIGLGTVEILAGDHIDHAGDGV